MYGAGLELSGENMREAAQAGGESLVGCELQKILELALGLSFLGSAVQRFWPRDMFLIPLEPEA